VHTGMNDREIVWALSMYVPFDLCPPIDSSTKHPLVCRTEYNSIFLGIIPFSSDSANWSEI
jgi:hypothetical protein